MKIHVSTFTIVATVRNEAASIRSFVDSLLSQSRQADEIIIVDGNSNDGTTDILREYQSQGRLRVVVEDCNIARGRNLGISAATGSHLAITDAGCIVDPDWLSHIAATFETDPSLDVVAGNFRFLTESAFERAVVLATFQPGRERSDAAKFYPSSRSVAFRKDAWKNAGGYPEWLYAAEDTLFNIRLRQIGCRFAFCPDAVVHWRPRETWRALARQRINFARGNARVGIGTAGYLLNLQTHSAMAAMLVLAPWQPVFLLLAAAMFGWHVRRHLWTQASSATAGQGIAMQWRVVGVMEFVRLVSVWGFLRGRWERRSDPSFVTNQLRYMGVTSVDELSWA